MTIAEQMTLLREELAEWTRTKRGHVEIASDAVHFVAELRSAPGAPRVAILFDGEKPVGDHDELGMVDRVFLVGISRGRGLNFDPSDSLTKGSTGGEPLFDLVEQLREVMRAVLFEPETTEGRLTYGGIERLEVPGLLLDAYTVRASLQTQIPEVPAL